MEKISDAFRSIKFEVLKTSLLHALLDSAIFLLLANLLMFLLGVGTVRITISVIAGIVFCFFDSVFRFRSFRLKTFESYNPEVSEILRTAYDNRDRKDSVAKSLFSETVSRLKTATTYKMVGHRKAIFKLLGLFVISLATMTVTVVNIQIINFSLPTEDSLEVVNVEKVNILQDDIYGDKQEIEIGERELELILSSSSNIDINEIKDIEEIDFQRENFPIDVVAQGEATNEEELPEDFDLIKNYNLKIRGFK